MADIAFLGLGAMGSRMAARLLAAGHRVTVWNRTPEAAAPLVAQGAIQASTPRDAACSAHMVLSMVRDDDASRATWEAEGTGAVHGLRPDALAIEMSTLTVGRVQALAATVKARGSHFLDAPLAGSRPQAEAGQLIFFVGGPAEALERARPLLMIMGSAVHATGGIGTGAAMKLMVNALFGAQVVMMAEVLALGEALGLEPGDAVRILGELPVTSPAAKGAAAAIAARSFAPQFPIELVAKDYRAVLETAEAAGANVPLSSALGSLFSAAVREELGGFNITGIAGVYGTPIDTLHPQRR